MCNWNLLYYTLMFLINYMHSFQPLTVSPWDSQFQILCHSSGLKLVSWLSKPYTLVHCCMIPVKFYWQEYFVEKTNLIFKILSLAEYFLICSHDLKLKLVVLNDCNHAGCSFAGDINHLYMYHDWWYQSIDAKI